MTTVETNLLPRRVALPSGLRADVVIKGSGDPLVFLHGGLGLTWDPFLEGLAERYTVYAPLHPGALEPDDLLCLDSFSDLVLYYDDLLRELGVDAAMLVGHSFGGMMAAEFAAYLPERVSKLVLIDPLGLWLDEAPIGDFSGTPSSRWGELLFADPTSPAALGLLAPPGDPDKKSEFMVQRMMTVASASHFIWAIPERGLRQRLYRISAPTLLVWGAQDAYVPAAYAQEFARGIRNSRVAILEGSGHFPQLECEELTRKEVLDFLEPVPAP